MMEHRNYEELHEHKGNKKYEVVTIVPENKEAAYIHYDTVAQNFVLDAYYEPVKKEDSTYQVLKVNKFGTVKDTFDIHTILKDGTMWDWKYCNNWIINGDTSKHSYIRPLTEKEEKDPDKWIEVFRDLYAKASNVYIYEGLGEYYFEVDKEWYKLGYNEAVNNAFNDRFPAKFSNVRMIELEDRSPSYVIPPEERDSSLIKQIDYESVFEKEVESAGGWSCSTCSAGWWYFQIYMPGGDTLKVKRFSSYRGPDVKLYKIPEQYGGRNNVLFIVLQPKDAHPDQVAGAGG